MQLSRSPWNSAITLSLALVLAGTATAQQSPPAEGDEAELIEVLKSDAEIFEKAKACQRLAVIGTGQSVPVLAGMLSDPQMAHYARYALEPNPDESVDEALREAAGELSGSLRVGVINSIGVRGDTGAAEMLVPLLEDSDPAVAGAAATTLARLKTPAAVAALLEVLPGPDEQRHLGAKACLIAADELLSDGEADRALAIYQELGKLEGPKFVRIAALQGSLRAKGPGDGLPMLVDLLEDDDQARFRVALAMAHAWGGDNVVAGLLDKLPDLPADRAALVIYT